MTVIVGRDAPDTLLRNAFTQRARAGGSAPEKDKQRKLVGNFVFANTPEGWTPRLVTMPGIGWEFEHWFQEHVDPMACFVGIEAGHGVIELGVPYMPLGYGDKRPLRVAIDHAGVKVEGWITKAACSLNVFSSAFVHMHASFREYKTAMSRGGVARGERMELKGFLHRLVNYATGVWWDNTSPLCEEVETTLRGTHQVLTRKAPSPVVVTVFKGRETVDVPDLGCPNLSRAVRIASLLNAGPSHRFELKEMWPYTSDGGAPMLTVAGVSTPR